MTSQKIGYIIIKVEDMVYSFTGPWEAKQEGIHSNA